MTRSRCCPPSEIRTMYGTGTNQHAQEPTSTPQSISVESTADHNKLLGLELLRFVSAFAVLVFHYQHFVYQGLAKPANFVRAQQPLYSVLALLYEHGFEGVRVF